MKVVVVVLAVVVAVVVGGGGGGCAAVEFVEFDESGNVAMVVVLTDDVALAACGS